MPSASLLAQGAAVGLLTGGVYALLSSGLTLIFGVMRVVHISHAAFLILAAYLTYWMNASFGLDPLLSIFITAPLFFVLGVGVQRLLLVRLKENATMMSVLLTFAIALVIEGGLVAAFTATVRGVSAPYAQTSLAVVGLRLPWDRIIGFAVAIVTFGILMAILRYTRYGQALRATAQHAAAAQLVGINTEAVKGVGFGLGLATAAVGGAVLALISPFFPSMHYDWIARLMAIIVVGGLGSIHGAVLAALLMGVVEGMVLVSINPTWGAMVFYAALFGTLIVRPQGFFGGRLAERF
ncbi:MAG TPA: branched-chain amino acid ABC transporter permease [Egibacteraceae bacterium]|nr:branched-chain amino acid ABC transporter permease [Egibacteraceae bacterium]